MSFILVSPGTGGGGGSGPFTDITGTPTEVAYFDASGNGTSDSNFTRNPVTLESTIARSSDAQIIPVVFQGSGLDDISVDYSGVFTNQSVRITIEITSAAPGNNRASFTDNIGTTPFEQAIGTGPIAVGNGIVVDFGSDSGHTLGDIWVIEYIGTASQYYSLLEAANSTNGLTGSFLNAIEGAKYALSGSFMTADGPTSITKALGFPDGNSFQSQTQWLPDSITSIVRSNSTSEQSVFTQEFDEFSFTSIGQLNNSTLSQFQGDSTITFLGAPLPFEGNYSSTTNGDFTSSSINAHLDVSSFASQPPGTFFAEQSAITISDSNTGDSASAYTLKLPGVFGGELSSGHNIELGSGLTGNANFSSTGTDMEWRARITDNATIDNRLVFSDLAPLEWQWAGNTIWKMPIAQGTAGDTMVLDTDGETLIWGSGGATIGQNEIGFGDSITGALTSSVQFKYREVTSIGFEINQLDLINPTGVQELNLSTRNDTNTVNIGASLLGGTFIISTADATGADDAGDIYIKAGDGAATPFNGDGGQLSIGAGSANDGTMAGSATIFAGDGKDAVPGANAIINAGNGTGTDSDGGNVILNGGDATGTGTPGAVVGNSGTQELFRLQNGVAVLGENAVGISKLQVDTVNGILSADTDEFRVRDSNNTTITKFLVDIPNNTTSLLTESIILGNSSTIQITRDGGISDTRIDLVDYGTTTNLTLADYDIQVGAAGTGATTINLPTGTNAPVGTVYIIKDFGGAGVVNLITIDAGTGNTIHAVLTAQTLAFSSLSAGAAVTLKKVTATAWSVE
jgi:hypothetical protein